MKVVPALCAALLIAAACGDSPTSPTQRGGMSVTVWNGEAHLVVNARGNVGTDIESGARLDIDVRFPTASSAH